MQPGMLPHPELARASAPVEGRAPPMPSEPTSPLSGVGGTFRARRLSLVRFPASRHLQRNHSDLGLIGAQPSPESAGEMEQRVPAKLEDQRSFRRNAVTYPLGG